MAFLMIVQVPYEPVDSSEKKSNESITDDVMMEKEDRTEGKSSRACKKDPNRNNNAVEEHKPKSNSVKDDSSTPVDNPKVVKKDSLDSKMNEVADKIVLKEDSETKVAIGITELANKPSESTENNVEEGLIMDDTKGKVAEKEVDPAEVKEMATPDKNLGDESEEEQKVTTDSEEKDENGTITKEQVIEIWPEKQDAISPTTLKNLVPLLAKIPLHQEVEHLLTTEGKVKNLEKTLVGNQIKFSFIKEDSKHCENVLNMLKRIGIGFTADTSISVFPSSVHESGKEDLETVTSEKSLEEERDETVQDMQRESLFKKSIKSRLVVAQVVASVRNNALFTFDYLLLLLTASFIACVGLVESSSVILVASMLISPLMGPILAGTFGQVVKMKDLRNLGVMSELVGLSLCLLVGFGFGLITGGIGLHGAVWGSSDQWPTPEMKSRGMLRSLWVGILIALPSGAGVAISVLSANAGSLVGVAISASLLPPACNAGMLWGYSLLAAIRPPDVEASSIMTTTVASTTKAFIENVTLSTVLSNSTSHTTFLYTLLPEIDTSGMLQCQPLVNNAYTPVYSCNLATDAALLGLVSLFLTMLNIICIFLVGVVFLKIKEVAPHTAGKEKATDQFWHEDVKVARTYYETSKGALSTRLGKQLLEEWKKIKHTKPKDDDDDSMRKDSMLECTETMEMCQYLSNMQNSPELQNMLTKLNTPSQDLVGDLRTEFDEARIKLEEDIVKHPGFALSNTVFQSNDRNLMRAYHTLSAAAPDTKKPSLFELHKRFRKMGGVQSMYLDFENEIMKTSPALSQPVESRLAKRRRQKKEKVVKFDVQRVNEGEEEPMIMP